MIAIYKRELKAYFTSLLCYFFLAAFFAMEGTLFGALYAAGSTSVHAIPFSFPLYLTVFMLPLLTMKTFSEERRQKIDQVLLTAPVNASSIVLGKFLACFTVFVVAFAPTMLFQVMVAFETEVSWFPYVYAMFGMWLLGAALIAVGMFISSLTESIVLAAVLSVGVNLLFVFGSNLASIIGVEWLTTAAAFLALVARSSNFGESILSIPDIIFFLSVIALFLFLNVRSLERRRWA